MCFHVCVEAKPGMCVCVCVPVPAFKCDQQVQVCVCVRVWVRMPVSVFLCGYRLPSMRPPHCFFCRRRQSLFAQPTIHFQVCPSSAASHSLLWELSDRPGISIHVIVIPFSVGKRSFVWMRTKGSVSPRQHLLSEKWGFCVWSTFVTKPPLSWYLNAGHGLGQSVSHR